MNNSDLIQIMLDLTKDKYGKSSLKEIRPIDRILSNSYPHGNPIHFHHPITNDPYTFSIDLDDDDSHLNAIRKANEVFNKIRVDLGKQGKYSEFRMDFPEWGFEVYLYYDEIEIDIDIARRIKIIDNEELFKLNDDDDDFIPRFNKTIYGFLKYKKEELEAEGRWSDKNIYFKPFQAFGDWFDRHPQDTDAESYFEEIADCDIGVSIDGEHRSAVEKVKKITKPKPPHKPKPPAPSGGEDFDSIWECAIEIRRLICQGEFGKPIKDVEIFKCYDWAVENCTVQGKPIEHRNDLINGYDNAKRKKKSRYIIAKFEEDNYD